MQQPNQDSSTLVQADNLCEVKYESIIFSSFQLDNFNGGDNALYEGALYETQALSFIGKYFEGSEQLEAQRYGRSEFSHVRTSGSN